MLESILRLTAGSLVLVLAVSLSVVESARGADEALLPFDQAYRTILDRSLRLQEQKIELEISRQERVQAWGQFTPRLAFELTEERAVELSNVANRSAQLTLRANLFRSGADLAGLRASRHDVESRRSALLARRQSVEDDAVEAIIEVIAASRRTAIVAQIVKLRGESLGIARERFARGLLPQQEVDKVVIEHENARARLIDTERDEAQARARLVGLLGQDRVALEWPWKTAITQGPKLETMGFNLERRPDWQAAQSNVDSKSALRSRAFRTLLPSVDLVAGYGNPNLDDKGRRDWSALLTLSVPIFDRLQGWTGYQIESLNETLARLQTESLQRTAPAEVDSLRISFKGARDSALNREKTAKVTARLYEDNFQRFRLGRTSVNDLAIDQNRLFESQLLEIEGWLSAHLSLARLCHALGGFVDPSAECHQEAPTF